MRLSPGSITTSLKNLEKAGLITREPDPTDGRRILLRFIPGSRTAINACFETVNRNLADLDGTLGCDELESVKKYFAGLLKIIDDYMGDHQPVCVTPRRS
jgi:DNA-binding MarR family transcriptional regulator